MKTLPYDETSPLDIERYAKQLIGHTFYDVLSTNFSDSDLAAKVKYYNNPRGRGTLGNLLEKYYFYYEPNNSSEPDFKKAKTELKVTPYEKNKNGSYRAGERLVITMIPNDKPISDNLFHSHLMDKLQLMLLIFYLRDRNLDRVDYEIDYATLFSILGPECKNDLKIIEEDYKYIADKVIAGKANELSESDTRYLGACTKGENAESSLKPQYYNKDVLAKRRAFSLKQSYMTYVINQYILKDVKTYESLYKSRNYGENFDEDVLSRIYKYAGMTEQQIYDEFNIDSESKNKNSSAVCRILGVSTKKVEEFVKANIEVKTIRLKKNGVPKESMSFPAITLRKFVNEEFEDSELYKYFYETRFLFVVFKEQDNGEYALSGAKFWNMPITELETTVQNEWKYYQKQVLDGVEFDFSNDKNGDLVVRNNLIKSKDTEIIHLRPHASKSAYIINGVAYGNGSDTDMDLLPDGNKMTKQCFWLNSKYVAKILKDTKKGE